MREQIWKPGRRPRGDSPATCMVIIIVLIVGGIWAYYRFYHNRALEQAGNEIVILADDNEARLNYLRRMRDTLLPGVRMVGGEINDFVMAVTAGKKTNKEQILDEITRFDDRLREQISLVNGQGVPKSLASYHKTLAVAVGNYWKALNALKEGLEAEDSKAKKNAWLKARKEAGAGQKNFLVSQSAIMAQFK